MAVDAIDIVERYGGHFLQTEGPAFVATFSAAPRLVHYSAFKHIEVGLTSYHVTPQTHTHRRKSHLDPAEARRV